MSVTEIGIDPILRGRRGDGVPMLTMMTLWEWRSLRETTKNLTRPEVARYLIRMTMELADILGIPLEEALHG
jgi:hypothetical protein